MKPFGCSNRDRADNRSVSSLAAVASKLRRELHRASGKLPEGVPPQKRKRKPSISSDELSPLIETFEQIARNRPAELERLIEQSNWDEIRSIVKLRPGRRSAKWRYDRSRGARRKGEPGLIERQFGTPQSVATMANHDPFAGLLRNCLDEVLQGGRVKMSRDWNSLENLFEKDRHLIAKILRQKKIKGDRDGREISYDYKAFLAISVQLLADGTWLPEAELRRRVLAGVARRLSEIVTKAPIKKAFQAFIDSGKEKISS